MTEKESSSIENEIIRPDYRLRFAETLKERDDNLEIPTEIMDAMVLAQNAMYERYGDPSKPSYHEYHNDIHTFNVATGSWRVLDFMKDKLNRDVQPMDYYIGGLIGTLHDIVHEATPESGLGDATYTVNFGDISITVENDGTKTDEILSAEVAVLFLNKLGLSSDIQQRVGKGIMLTEVIFEEGTVVQKNAGKGGRDYGAIAAAIADTEGIFGGEERLSKDVARLIAETLGDKVVDEGLVTEYINKFTETEAIFVKQKLAEFILHILGTENDPVKRQSLSNDLNKHFAPLEEKALTAAGAFDARISDIQQIRRMIIAHIHRTQSSLRSLTTDAYKKEK
jgi:hypothetical protein